MNYFDELVKSGKNNFIFLGEGGAGKTEVSINLAKTMSRITDKEIHFFDMDQSKPLYRSRDLDVDFDENEIFFHHGQEFLSAPFVPSGINEVLSDENKIAILDVGGNMISTINIGQFSEMTNSSNSVAFFVINGFRIFSGDSINVERTINNVLKASRIEKCRVISNPNYGIETSFEDILEGHRIIMDIMDEVGLPVEVLAVKKQYEDCDCIEFQEHVFGLNIYMDY